MKTVFILGAGASADAGAPVMSNFLERARTLRRQGRLDDCADAIDDVLRAADNDLLPLYAKSRLDVDNIEDLFSAISMGQLVGKYGSRSESEISGMENSIVVFICRVIEECIRFQLVRGYPQPTKTYGAFANLLKERLSHPSGRQSEFGVITFNYDFALENALWYHRILADYSLGEEMLDSQGSFNWTIPILKLHGSLNWAREAESKKVVPIAPIASREILGRILPGTTADDVALKIGSGIAKRGYSKGSLESLPYIIPPTWNKVVENGQLKSVWRAAAAQIGEAENIFVIGFSFPNTDRFFRYLFALGAMSSTRIRNFVVVDTDADVANRFRELTGQVSGKSFRAVQSTFAKSMDEIKRVIAD